MDADLRREDLLLLIAAGVEGPYDLDPIRLMKGVFLAWERGPASWRGYFTFEPYDYGPFDSAVYTARDALLQARLLKSVRKGRYESYELTSAGLERVGRLESLLPGRPAEWLKSIGAYVTARSFAQLLREIYDAYPAYATRSLISH